ncbi:MAG: GntR family transcriptional regulator [Halanaerobiales bacterium]|nr:GntR family transcriptional regulator [Halanaerobiales bacterium]
MVKLSNESPLPLYYQMKEILKKNIKLGELKPGDQLPSERDLEETYGVSRMTARRALVELCNEGYVYRKQGRGTFVADMKYHHHLFRLSSFTEESQSQHLKPGAKVLKIEKVENEAICKKLKIESEPLISIRRIRTINEEPVALEETYVRAVYCPGLEEVNLNNTSLYSYLTEEYHLLMGRAEQTIESRLVPLEVAPTLKVEKGTPILYMERTTYLENEETPFEYAEAIYRGDKYKLMVEMQR